MENEEMVWSKGVGYYFCGEILDFGGLKLVIKFKGRRGWGLLDGV